MKKVLLFVASICLSGLLTAQDIHFSQFYMSPLNLNPALTGVMNCNMRLVGNYRNQYASILKSNAFNTFSVSYDQKIPVGRYDYFGVGGTLWGDKAGSAGFGTVQARLSGSYSKRMSGSRYSSNYLVFGADLGLSQRRINFAKLQWGTQHDGNGGYDPNLNSGETKFDRDNFLFLDMSAGLLWFNVFNKTNSFYLGGAFSHMNRANQSFDTDTYDGLYSKFTIHSGLDYVFPYSRIGLNPGIVAFIQGPSMQINTGTNIKFLLSGNKRTYEAFQFGAWVRLANKIDSGILADALILSTRFDFEQFGIGFSYDLNISSLKNATNHNGAFEFSGIYNICGPERRGVYCPRF
ncbi:MAG TPA: PorP/SprF family type IX secretion system membrane protein [Saprospiraceae bacterium]|nr:PorP/SprF family type IX secretion system membrane protein [Saprospiraceae bacterium]HMV22908.1 PorP/SprF family type IX secretion system membrane protein [Saprospiraceae bacterium]HMW74414.1 PorP/SprF family type IX secretion system membrane protein [Saprospiraceae bacterium]HMX82568.1 PorP/SprF family type IX secretion system membrane protein [Saprospiraceae bacterium]HMX85981.1 PorP/SprF family type IX secretion system membrane protein [Saprospiraceae bacterium]